MTSGKSNGQEERSSEGYGYELRSPYHSIFNYYHYFISLPLSSLLKKKKKKKLSLSSSLSPHSLSHFCQFRESLTLSLTTLFNYLSLSRDFLSLSLSLSLSKKLCLSSNLAVTIDSWISVSLSLSFCLSIYINTQREAQTYKFWRAWASRSCMI